MFSRNLLILQTRYEQDPSDWIAVQKRIERDAPDIEVRIADNGHANSVTARWQVRRPSVVFSPSVLIDFVPRGGAVFSGRLISKDKQLLRLSGIGILTPRTEILSPLSFFDPKEWGDYLVVKPSRSHSGHGVKLVRTADLRSRYSELTAAANDSFLVQPFIDHTEDGYPTEYRVLTLFGHTLYCARNRWGNVRPSLAEIAADRFGVIASNNNRWAVAFAQSAMMRKSSRLASEFIRHFPNARCLASTSFETAKRGNFTCWRSTLMALFGTFRHRSPGHLVRIMSANFMPNSMHLTELQIC
jgi:hypothetical protein